MSPSSRSSRTTSRVSAEEVSRNLSDIGTVTGFGTPRLPSLSESGTVQTQNNKGGGEMQFL
jgi:hypothetical protein